MSKRNRKPNRKKKNKTGNIISTIILIIAVCVFVVAAYQLLLNVLPYYQGGKDYDKVKALAVQTDGTDDKDAKTSGEEQVEEAALGFKVDFATLLEMNPDTVAWIRFDEPSIISYPVVKSQDNNEYLTKTFTANDNKLGAIFVDKDCASDFSGRNTLIYGHHLNYGGEMFSRLNEYADESFCKAHPYFYIYTPDGKTRTYQVFSAGVVKDMADNYILSYATDEDFMKYIELCRSTSNYAVDVEVNVQSKIVSLSTCTNVNEDERFLLQGVLVEEK